MSSPDGIASEPAPRATRRGRRIMLLTAVTVAVVGVATAGFVFAATANDTAAWGESAPLQPFATPSLPLVRPERAAVPEPQNSLSPEELGHAVIDAPTLDWIESLQTAVRDDPSFGSVAISEDRATVTITWFGDPSLTLREQIDTAPAKLRVIVQAAAFSPAELQELVLAAMRPGLVPGIQVTAGGPETDGSGLRLSILELPAGQTLEDVGNNIAIALERTDVPISVEVSGPVIALAGSG